MVNFVECRAVWTEWNLYLVFYRKKTHVHMRATALHERISLSVYVRTYIALLKSSNTLESVDWRYVSHEALYVSFLLVF